MIRTLKRTMKRIWRRLTGRRQVIVPEYGGRISEQWLTRRQYEKLMDTLASDEWKPVEAEKLRTRWHIRQYVDHRPGNHYRRED